MAALSSCHYSLQSPALDRVPGNPPQGAVGEHHFLSSPIEGPVVSNFVADGDGEAGGQCRERLVL